MVSIVHELKTSKTINAAFNVYFTEQLIMKRRPTKQQMPWLLQMSPPLPDLFMKQVNVETLNITSLNSKYHFRD